MTFNIADLTLDDVVSLLISGQTLQVAGGEEFSLPLADSRAILAFYNRDRRAYWNPDQDTTIREGEIDSVLAALDQTPAQRAAPVAVGNSIRKWQLVKVEAHRFRGLHRHCAENGADPRPFEFDLSAAATLFRGFNGAGKTSLISAMCWCLTGYGHRSQGLPAPLHDCIAVKVAGASGAEGNSSVFNIPAVVPVPTDKELIAVDGVPKTDTWVRLTFRSLIDGTEQVVERRLMADGKKTFKTTVTGLDQLGLSDLALQVGTLMPGVAAATRFDDKTTLSQAVSTLTGLRPLAHFGSRCERVHDRLTDKFPKQAKQDKTNAALAAAQQIQTLADLLKDGDGLPALDCVVVPTDAAPIAWQNGLVEAERRLKATEDQAASEAKQILGSLPLLSMEAEIKRFRDGLTSAQTCFSPAALKSLPSMQLSARLGAPEADWDAAETVIDNIEAEAKRVVENLAQAGRADRLRLYGLVASWHESVHPGQPFDECPVCYTDLTRPGAIPEDALLSQSVADALDQARKSDKALLRTAAEWERDALRALRERLPAELQPFAHAKVPDDLADIYVTALSEEVFAQQEFPAALRSMAAGIKELCRTAWKAGPQREALPGATIPAEIPDNEGLRAAITKVRRASNLARYRSANSEFAKAAMAAVLHSDKPEGELPANERSIAGQIGALKAYLDAVTVFVGIRHQLNQIKQTGEKWKAAGEKLERLERAAAAVEPFKRFPNLVHDQVTGLISALDSEAAGWANRMYKAQFLQAPSYAGLDPSKSNGLSLLAAHGSHRVEAHHVMNASALRAYLSAFVLALWQQIWARSGGISVMLMDDPQDLLDPSNIANLASTIPYLIDAGMNPVITSNDFGFIPAVEAFVKAHKPERRQSTDVHEFSAISTSKCTASLAPVADSVRLRCDQWQKTDPNDAALARAFVHPVRVRIETKLWDLLASDPAILRDPTLGDLLGKISNARNRGEQPFNEEPFKRLIDLPALKVGAPFRDAINKAHHGMADQISPAEADVVRQGFEEVFDAIDACWLAYARFMGRLPPEQAAAEVTGALAQPSPVSLTLASVPVIGRLAAREVGAAFSTVDDAAESFDLTSLGQISLFTLRAPTLGLVAFPGQTLIVSLTAEVRNGDFAIVQTPGRVYARRIGIDKSDPARIALETMPSSNSKAPPTHFVQRSSAVLSKIIGVLFDETTPQKSQDEAVPLAHSAILSGVTAAATVAGDSAFPVAVDSGHVLLGSAPDISLLEGRILAVLAKSDMYSADYVAYLKRLGKRMPGNHPVYYLENVGQSGEGEYVQLQSENGQVDDIPIVHSLWKVLGTTFR